MKNSAKFLAGMAVAVVLAGCNLPFMNKAKEIGGTVKEKIGGVAEQIGNEATEPESDYAESDSSDNSEGSATNMDDCLKGCAILTGTGMFSKEFCQDSCWASKAEETGDVTICDTKVSQDNSLVLFACYLNVAEKNKDAKFCDKIGDNPADMMRAGCYSSVAEKTKDPSVCEGIKGTFLYESCLSDAKGE